MLTSSLLRKKNIAEYILYMWQTEDYIRSARFDIETLLHIFKAEEPHIETYKQWFQNLISMMEIENIKQNGHLQILQNIVIDLNNLHLTLLQLPIGFEYSELYENVESETADFQQRMKTEPINTVDIWLHALYMTAQLRIQKKSVSAATYDSVKKFGKILSALTIAYHKRERDPDSYSLN